MLLVPDRLRPPEMNFTRPPKQPPSADRKPLADLAAAPPPGGERVPVGVVFEAGRRWQLSVALIKQATIKP